MGVTSLLPSQDLLRQINTAGDLALLLALAVLLARARSSARWVEPRHRNHHAHGHGHSHGAAGAGAKADKAGKGGAAAVTEGASKAGDKSGPKRRKGARAGADAGSPSGDSPAATAAGDGGDAGAEPDASRSLALGTVVLILLSGLARMASLVVPTSGAARRYHLVATTVHSIVGGGGAVARAMERSMMGPMNVAANAYMVYPHVHDLVLDAVVGVTCVVVAYRAFFGGRDGQNQLSPMPEGRAWQTLAATAALVAAAVVVGPSGEVPALEVFLLALARTLIVLAPVPQMRSHRAVRSSAAAAADGGAADAADGVVSGLEDAYVMLTAAHCVGVLLRRNVTSLPALLEATPDARGEVVAATLGVLVLLTSAGGAALMRRRLVPATLLVAALVAPAWLPVDLEKQVCAAEQLVGVMGVTLMGAAPMAVVGMLLFSALNKLHGSVPEYLKF